jgi:hypothetical protein
MTRFYVDQATIRAFLHQLNKAFNKPGRLYLTGETSQVVAGWRRWTERLEMASQLALEDEDAFRDTVDRLAAEIEVEVLDESPGDVIPLPTGHEARMRPVKESPGDPLQVYHFDPYSVAFRLIARGDEPDYRAVIAYLEHGWLQVDEMNRLLTGLLPQFTSETIQQDPAEFRRKYRGLLQMWRAGQGRQRNLKEL